MNVLRLTAIPGNEPRATLKISIHAEYSRTRLLHLTLSPHQGRFSESGVDPNGDHENTGILCCSSPTTSPM